MAARSAPAQVPFVMAAVDGSERDATVVRWATAEAGYRELPVRLVHVVDPPGLPPYDPDLSSQVLADYAEQARAVLSRAREGIARQPVTVPVGEVARTGGVVPTLLAEAAGAAMVVLGSGQRISQHHVALGSRVTHVAAHAPCPVLVVRDTLARYFTGAATGQVVVGVDGSPASQDALGFAFEEASWRGLPLTAVHAWQETVTDRVVRGLDPDQHRQVAGRILADALAGWPEKYPDVPVTERVVWDRPAHALLDAAAGAVLLVVAAQGRGRFPGMHLGSVSQTVLRHAPASVAVVRSRG